MELRSLLAALGSAQDLNEKFKPAVKAVQAATPIPSYPQIEKAYQQSPLEAALRGDMPEVGSRMVRNMANDTQNFTPSPENNAFLMGGIDAAGTRDITKAVARKLGGKLDGQSLTSPSSYAVLADGTRLRISDHAPKWERSMSHHEIQLEDGMGMDLRNIAGEPFDDPSLLLYNGQPVRSYPVNDMAEVPAPVIVGDIVNYLKKQYELSGKEAPKRARKPKGSQ